MDHHQPGQQFPSTHPHHHEGTSSQKPTPRTTPAPMPAFQPPPAAQPPVQMPFSNPFHNRDPFLPNTQHRRKESYGGGPPPIPLGGERSRAAQQGSQFPPSFQHAPYPPQQSYQGDSRASIPYDYDRRRSIGGAISPPRQTGGQGTSDHQFPLPPPPPSSFAARNMPPPSPSASTTPSFAHHAQRPPPSSSSIGNGGRDSLRYPRPSAGMSIGSLIGNDNPPRRDRSPKAATTQNSPTFTSHPPSPKRARSTSMRSDFQRASRPLSPRNGGHGPSEHVDDRDRDRSIFARPISGAQHPLGPLGYSSFRPYQSSPTSVAGLSHHTNGSSAPPPRPNSQPMAAAQDRVEAWRAASSGYRAPAGFREYPMQAQEPQKQQFSHDYHPSAPSDRARTELQPYLSQGYPHQQPDRNERERPAGYPHPHDRRGEYDDRRAIEALQRAGPTSSPTSVGDVGLESRFRHYGGPPADRDLDNVHPHARRDHDGNPIPRQLLTVSPELNRKGGRSSPLPQAVQGAQPRLIGPGRERIEFGRMFSGLGSGVGGSATPTASFSASGNLTPTRMSPTRYVDGEHENIVEGTSMLYRNDRDAMGREELNDANGSMTPTGQKGGKRMKTGHAVHHHHHHGHAHHHHYHHPQAEENSPQRGGFSTLRFPATSQPSTNATHHHHHNHANHVHTDHHHHHHHHAAKPAASSHAPETIVRSQQVISEAATKPKVHLGNALYNSTLSLPSSKRVLIDTRMMFDSTSTPMPSFHEDQENCTFTIRVPREYLVSSDTPQTVLQVAGGLEEICKRRAVWGTDIYTDDSDVVAAAVHSGWIKGDFGEFNEDIKDLFHETSESDPSSVDGLMTKPPHPVSIPGDKDMHITILVLPALKDYASSTMNHLRSRHWGESHDGMSYMIHRIEFVDEPRWSRFEARGGQARKTRVREEQKRRREAAESLLGLLGSRTRVAAV